jgi:hypothetical protein
VPPWPKSTTGPKSRSIAQPTISSKAPGRRTIALLIAGEAPDLEKATEILKLMLR